MKKIILTYGLLSGAISALMMSITAFGIVGETIDFDSSAIIGYTSIVLSSALIFFGIRSYRDKLNGGFVTFGKAFRIGVLIALISSICYVLTWLVVYYNFMPDFMDKYSSHVIENMKSSGAAQADIDKKTEQMQQFGEMYKNPFLVVALTFLEPFPIGLLIALISSLILKRKGAASLAT